MVGRDCTKLMLLWWVLLEGAATTRVQGLPEGRSHSNISSKLRSSHDILSAEQKNGHNTLVKQRSTTIVPFYGEGVISSPGYPAPVQQSTEFVRNLVAPECVQVKLTFTDFQIQPRSASGICEADRLTITTSETTTTTYCGEEISPGTMFYSSSSPSILLEFYSSQHASLVPMRGFNATVEHNFLSRCSPIITTTTGVIPTPEPITTTDAINVGVPNSLDVTIEPILIGDGVVTSPGYPTSVLPDTQFVREAVAPYCFLVKITFMDFQIQPRSASGSCEADRLTITTSDTNTTTYCGEEIAPGTIFFSDTMARIMLEFYSSKDASSSPVRGFNATIESIFWLRCSVTSTVVNPPTEPTTAASTPIVVTTPNIATTVTLVGATTALMPTTGVTIINSGRNTLFLPSTPSGRCGLKTSSSVAGAYELTSRRYPCMYWPGDSCSVDLGSNEPRALRLTATEVSISSSETIVIKSLFGNETRINPEQEGNSYLFPSPSVNVFFDALKWWFGRRFKLQIEIINSNCHQIIELDVGATGTLSKTNYAADTVCEWWIRVPSGNEIQLDFSSFDVGTSTCSGDYLAIDTSGDTSYSSASQQYCGTNSPGTVTSSGGQLNVLLNGAKGEDPGFIATYNTVTYPGPTVANSVK